MFIGATSENTVDKTSWFHVLQQMAVIPLNIPSLRNTFPVTTEP